MKYYIIFCFLLLFTVTVIKGQNLTSLVLRVKHINDYSIGYNPGMGTYDGNFIRNVITNPATRPVHASVARSIPVTRVRTLPIDQGNCPTIELRLVSSRAAAFVYSLKGRHPLLNTIRILQKIRKDLNVLPSNPNEQCVPVIPAGMKPVLRSDCEVTFSVPIPVQQVPDAQASYTVQFDVLDANDNVIHTLSRKISVLAYVPLIVSIGDSFASGEGNPDKAGKSIRDLHSFTQKDCDDDATVMIQQKILPDMEKDPEWLDARFHRSLRSSHALAAMELLNEWPYVNFLSFAKSGARILSGERENDIVDQLTHVSSLLGDHKIDALIISAGGNDVGFSEVLTTMAGDFRDSDADRVFAKFKERLGVLRDQRYPMIDDKIKDLGLNIGTILINEYPNHIFNNSNGQPAAGCGIFNTLKYWEVSRNDAITINNMGILLNKEVKNAADRFGWRYISGISELFVRHGYCSNDTYFVGGSESCHTQGNFDGTMHPNAKGTLLCAKAIAVELRKVLRRSPSVSH